MDPPYLGEIRFFAFNFAPKGWALCDGQLMLISQNEALFALIGTFYGGDGVNTFALPDLRGRVPFGQGNDHVMGEVGGSEAAFVSVAQMPAHGHQVLAATTPSATALGGKLGIAAFSAYAKSGTLQSLNAIADASTGSSQPHSNMQPYMVGNLCIALQGQFPSRS